ncbi:ankyrin repeat protein [Diplodia corticola]|uniref:Ankyrin repeat protein n=1 Tax=Diplodia corticola TaxID=236234 RepID=A0A1J9QTF3_9PEZI|nr:ankyrin repeat protein [Diplodia corticola]OJD31266.1 ankyrin repeat protein [Diplodia corticola]
MPPSLLKRHKNKSNSGIPPEDTSAGDERQAVALLPSKGDDDAETDSSPLEEVQSFGLFELWPATPDGQPCTIQTEVDIVAVHGLGGGAFRTWTADERLWLRDFLPQTVPEARILTFGYNSAAAFSGSASRIDDFALDLLNRLRANRRRARIDLKRKTMFVCHSLGGIVLKQALILAHARSDLHGWFTDSTIGIIFMGTPHRGADVAYWSKVLGRFVNVFAGSKVRTDILHDLEPKSQTLGRLCELFVERAKSLAIYSFYERRKMAGINSLVVDEHSAILHLPNERSVPVEADHREICKFLTSSNQNYALVLDAILDLVEVATGQQSEHHLNKFEVRFLRFLAAGDWELVLKTIKDRWRSSSCNWITRNAAFDTWTKDLQSKCLWIHGPPGSGKSVMAKHLVQYLKVVLDDQPRDSGSVQNVTFFFCDNKIPALRTSRHLLRSILAQIFQERANHHLFQHFDSELLGKIGEDEVLATSDEAACPRLLEVLLTLITKARGFKFWIVIDAVDELEPIAYNTAFSCLERLLQADSVGRMKILITARSKIQSEFQQQIQPDYISIMGEDTMRDVDDFVTAQVGQLCAAISAHFPVSQQLRKQLEDEVLDISGGNFLHAHLALANFSRRGLPQVRDEFSRRVSKMRNLTADLGSLYVEVFRRIPAHFIPVAKSTFNCVLAAQQPFSLKDLHFFVTLNERHSHFEQVMDEMNTRYAEQLSEFCGSILTLDLGNRVTFIHQSVKDVLIADDPSIGIPAYFSTSLANAHAELAEKCLLLLSWAQFGRQSHRLQLERSLARIEFPFNLPWRERVKAFVSKGHIRWFLDFGCPFYAIKHWMLHVDSAGPQARRTRDLLGSFIIAPGAQYFRLVGSVLFSDSEARLLLPSRHWQLLETFEEPPLHFAMQFGDFPDIILRLIQAGEDVNEVNKHGWTPLHWAIALSRTQSFRTLLASSKTDPNRGNPKADKPIQAAILAKRPSFALELLQDSRTDLNTQGTSGYTTLHAAFIEKQEEVVKCLLQEHRNLDLTLQDDKGVTPMETAFRTRQPGHVILALLRRLENLSRPGSIPSEWSNANLLQHAIDNGICDLEASIIEKDPGQIFDVDRDGFNALTKYAFRGRRQKVEMLLQKTDEVNGFRDTGRYSLLHLCAHQNWEDLVKLLYTRYKAKDVEGDHVGRTMLHWSVENLWSMDTVDISGKPRAWLDRQDRDGLTALHLAMLHRNRAAVQRLVGKGTDPLISDKHGRSAVHIAAEQGFTAALRILLDDGVIDRGTDRDGMTVIHFLAMWEKAPLIEEYIGRGHYSVNILDRRFRSPLHYAAIFGNLSATRALLLSGADPRQRDSAHKLPIHLASQSGHQSVVEYLSERQGSTLGELDGFRQTCLQLAIRNGNRSLIQHLVSSEAMIHNRDIFGKTALHRACVLGDAALVHQLVMLGADAKHRDHLGYEPLDTAIIWREWRVVNVLVSLMPWEYLFQKLSSFGLSIEEKSSEHIDDDVGGRECLVEKLVQYGLWLSALTNPYLTTCQGEFLREGVHNAMIPGIAQYPKIYTASSESRSQHDDTRNSSVKEKDHRKIPKPRSPQASRATEHDRTDVVHSNTPRHKTHGSYPEPGKSSHHHLTSSRDKPKSRRRGTKATTQKDSCVVT